ncbi:hypothetical protein WDU94_000368 [Cyamophila willieti]
MASVVHVLFLVSSYCSVYCLKANESHAHNEKAKLETNEEKEIGDQCRKSIAHLQEMKIQTVEKGIPNTKDYWMYYKSALGFISPLHDIPLYANFEDQIFNMVLETSSFAIDKIKINLGEALNPIRHDTKQEWFIWNHGTLPQTWQNPNEVDSYSKYKRNGKPLDVLEIEESAQKGDIMQVKVLGALGFIDDGKIDWKIIAIGANNEMAERLNDISDVDHKFPGAFLETSVFFRRWKKLQKFGEPKNREFAHKLIADANNQWIQLMAGKVKAPADLSVINTCVKGSKGKISFKEAKEELNKRVYPTAPSTTPRSTTNNTQDENAMLSYWQEEMINRTSIEEITNNAFHKPSTTPGSTTNNTQDENAMLSYWQEEMINRTSIEEITNNAFPPPQHLMKLIRRGVHRTPEYRLFFKTPDGFISPLHDIPLYSDFENKIFNVIVENKMLESKKNMKLHLGEALNPLRQITTKRFYPWNDGVFPQTWDNTSELDPQVKHIVGHPMHFMDIGSKGVKRGEIIQVRALGVLGVELKGNMYWKVVVINVRDKKADRVTDLQHVQDNFPEYLQNTVKSYNYWEKVSFAKVRDGKYALKMIEKMHAQWLKMVHGKFKCPGVSKINTCLEGSPNKISCQEAEKEFKKKTNSSQPRPK